MTLGSPLVSPEFARCHVPADRRQRMGESAGRSRDRPTLRYIMAGRHRAVIFW